MFPGLTNVGGMALEGVSDAESNLIKVHGLESSKPALLSFLVFSVSHSRSSISLVVLVTCSVHLMLLTRWAALRWVGGWMELA